MKKVIPILFTFWCSNVFAFDTWWHAECTRKAMAANGFSDDARLATQVSNYLTDFNSVAFYNQNNKDLDKIKGLRIQNERSFEYLHFDAIYSTKDIAQNWEHLFNNTVAALRAYSANSGIKKGFIPILAFNIIGASLHTAQDFYSHSNWIEIFNELKQPLIPTWFGADSIYKMKLNIVTGAYPNGSMKGMKNHDDLNKDHSMRANNDIAVVIATKASIEWVQKIMEATPELPWDELKNYKIQDKVVMKRFLFSLDATFLTSSSIVAGHLDGKEPLKFIFSKDKNKVKEYKMATEALVLTAASYADNLINSYEGSLAS